MLHESCFSTCRALSLVGRAAETTATALRGMLTPARLLATLPLLLAGAFLGVLSGGAALGFAALSGLLVLIGAPVPATG